MNYPPQHPAQPVGPTTWQKFKMGAVMGGSVGATIGFLFGTFAVLRGGAGPRGFMGTVSQYMLSSAATFATFMSIGSVIRTEDHEMVAMDRRRLQLAPQFSQTPLTERLKELRKTFQQEK